MSGSRCELCDAARLTEWFHEDEECWIAECEACAVPMVVWRTHDPEPTVDVKDRLHARQLRGHLLAERLVIAQLLRLDTTDDVFRLQH